MIKSIASGAGFLAAAIITLVPIAIGVGIADKGLTYTGLTIGALAYWVHRDNVRRQQRLKEHRLGRLRTAPEQIRLSPAADAYARQHANTHPTHPTPGTTPCTTPHHEPTRPAETA